MAGTMVDEHRAMGAVVVVGATTQVAPLLQALRLAGFQAFLALAPSDVHDLLAEGHKLSLAIVDPRAAEPWRSAGIEKMASVLATRSIRLLCIGRDSAAAGPPDATRFVLPDDAPVAAVVQLVQSLHAQHGFELPDPAPPVPAPASPNRLYARPDSAPGDA